jgi:hypothetical protein
VCKEQRGEELNPGSPSPACMSMKSTSGFHPSSYLEEMYQFDFGSSISHRSLMIP